MEDWRDVFLIVIILGAFAFGYFLMARVDSFLCENRRAIRRKYEKPSPSCVILAENIPDEELAEAVRGFRRMHKKAQIILFDCTAAELSEYLEHHTHAGR